MNESIGIGIGGVSKSGMTAIRWYSAINSELDCVCFVPDKDKINARNAIERGVNKFWRSNMDIPYGVCIEDELLEANIPYIILYPELTKDWTGYDECLPEWDEWADNLDALTIR